MSADERAEAIKKSVLIESWQRSTGALAGGAVVTNVTSHTTGSDQLERHRVSITVDVGFARGYEVLLAFSRRDLIEMLALLEDEADRKR